jgi:precorrin-2 dehydrogenase/sirohydrochlorin ferrochelatase
MPNTDLVVVALPFKDLNKDIFSLAKRHGVLVNLANDADMTEVVVPFETTINGIRIAATSEGKSGLVVKEALNRIERSLNGDEELFNLLELMFYLKNYMKREGIPFETRMILYHKVFNDKGFRQLVSQGRIVEARELLESIVKTTADSDNIKNHRN